MICYLFNAIVEKTAEDFNAALLSQKQNIDHAMDSICEFDVIASYTWKTLMIKTPFWVFTNFT